MGYYWQPAGTCRPYPFNTVGYRPGEGERMWMSPSDTVIASIVIADEDKLAPHEFDARHTVQCAAYDRNCAGRALGHDRMRTRALRRFHEAETAAGR